MQTIHLQRPPTPLSVTPSVDSESLRPGASQWPQRDSQPSMSIQSSDKSSGSSVPVMHSPVPTYQVKLYV